MYIEKLASAIKNDVISGLGGYHQNLSLNIEQLQDEIIATRLSIIEQLYNKGVLSVADLYMAINCIDVKCSNLERCPCKDVDLTPVAHFEIPQIVNKLGKSAIQFIGSIDRMVNFNVLFSLSELQNFKYRKRGNNKPSVLVDLAPNNNGMLDCFIFNAPFVENISIVAAFKDPRQLCNYECCNLDELTGSDTNFSSIDQLVKTQLTLEKIKYYRQLKAVNKPNTQSYE